MRPLSPLCCAFQITCLRPINSFQLAGINSKCVLLGSFASCSFFPPMKCSYIIILRKCTESSFIGVSKLNGFTAKMALLLSNHVFVADRFFQIGFNPLSTFVTIFHIMLLYKIRQKTTKKTHTHIGKHWME